jgi:hypothetical protein
MLNGYGDNGQRKVWSSGESTHCTYQLRSLSCCPCVRCLVTAHSSRKRSPFFVTYSAWNSKDSYDMACEYFVVQFNGFTSLTS